MADAVASLALIVGLTLTVVLILNDTVDEPLRKNLNDTNTIRYELFVCILYIIAAIMLMLRRFIR